MFPDEAVNHPGEYVRYFRGVGRHNGLVSRLKFGTEWQKRGTSALRHQTCPTRIVKVRGEIMED